MDLEVILEGRYKTNTLNTLGKEYLAKCILSKDNIKDVIEIVAKFEDFDQLQMVINCLECSHKGGLPFNLAFHYSIYHEDKISKCACGDKTVSGICMKTNCSFKDESGYNSSSCINFNSNSSSNSSSSSSSNMNSSINSIYNSNANSNFNCNTKVLTRNCNKCNSVNALTDFDESKYTCRNCTSAEVNCLFCPSVVRCDGIKAHVKKQHPDVELPRGFSRNSTERSVELVPRSGNLLRRSVELLHRSVIGQTGEGCSRKHYNFLSFLLNNGINIEKVKESINLLKSIDSLK